MGGKSSEMRFTDFRFTVELGRAEGVWMEWWYLVVEKLVICVVLAV